MFKIEVYTQRRNQLKKNIKSGLVLLLGNNESPMNYPNNTYHYRQDSSFLYFYGLNIPGLAGVIDIESGEDYLYGNNFEIDDIIWMGPQPSIDDLAAKAGVKNTAPLAKLQEVLQAAIKQGRKVHFLPPYRAENKIYIESLLNIIPAKQKESASIELIKAVVNLRAVKDKYELVELEKATEIGYNMHIAAMKMARAGIYEREIAGVMEGIAIANGGNVSFPVILSINGEILHNHYHGNLLKDGDLLISDAGAETTMNYSSDFTRTIPVNGKFSQKQKEIYEIVLKANNAAFDATKPNVTYKSCHLIAAKTIAAGLKDLGLMKGDIENAVKQGAHCLFFPHGLGHMIGLDVHDMEDLGENYVGYDEETVRAEQFGTAYLRMGRRLQPNFLITNEPGIYFIPALIDIWKKENKFAEFINYAKVEEYRNFGGIRIEDVVLVTETGSKILGKRLPATVAEVEEAMKK